jgi:hypothetical protein
MFRLSLKPKKKRYIATTLSVIVFLQLVLPLEVLALTGGPSAPEFSTFQPVATTDMVNVFTGDFSYNLPVIEIPGPDGAGYGLSLSYHSGASAEQEASWCGFGWSLNPGAINREVRGLPDDYNDSEVIQYKKTKPNWSYSSTHSVGNIEIFGADLPLSVNNSYAFNNYTGYSRYVGLGISIKGMAGLNMNLSDDGSLTFSPYVNPLKIFKSIFESIKKADDSENSKNSTKNETEGKLVSKEQQLKQFHERRVKSSLEGKFSSSLSKAASSYGLSTYSEVVRGTSVESYKGDAWNWTTSIMQLNASQLPAGPEFSISGNLNIQANIPRQKFESYGYIYSPDTSLNQNTLSDHYYENDSPYNKRDYNLGIPFNNHDQFNVSGEGIGGGFRFFTKNLGHFYPNFVNSTSEIKSGGIEFMLGTNIGVGLDIGFGEQTFSSSYWDNPGNTEDYQFNHTNNAGFFRFNNDMGGKVEYSNSTNAQSARVTSPSNFPGAKKGKPTIPTSVSNSINVTGSSSFISNTTLGQIRSDRNNRINKNINTDDLENYISANTRLENSETVLEFQTINENGAKYTYGLPVFNSDELNLQVSLEAGRNDCRNNSNTSSRNCIEDNYLAFQDLFFTTYDNNVKEPDLSRYETVSGEFKKEPFVKNYLLTQITNYDYIDVGDDGTGEEDFGAWTNFHYHQKFSILDSPYRWRSPYFGLQYIKNSISDPNDDLGALLTGYKDIYYLKAIETKTHIAFFVTNKTDRNRFNNTFKNTVLPTSMSRYIEGSQVDRFDGLGAPKILSNQDPSANSNNQKGNTQQLEFLEKIVLFSKTRLDKPIKTVHFDYDYSLVKNLPNNINGTFPRTNNSLNSGKLTLKKLWFEYEGEYRTRISPYQFSYEYKSFSDDFNYLKNKFEVDKQEIFEYSNFYSSSSQNPNYEPYLLDGWGNVQSKARERHREMNPWVYQGKITESFDPGAWQLKQIKLPSGGEILVQYEQKDYRYIQDRPAMAMVSIDEMLDGDEFYLNLNDIGIDNRNREEVEGLANEIIDYYGSQGEKEKIFYKFLFSFSSSLPSIDLNSCNAEYISGYSILDDVQIVQDPLDPTRWKLRIIINNESSGDGDRTTLPKQACFDFYKSQRDGWNTNDCNYDRNLDLGLNIARLAGDIEDKAQSDPPYTDINTNLADFELFFKLFGLEAITSVTRIATDIETAIDALTVCGKINPELSYFKIPVTKPKRGGGVRVKRLLIFDPGIEANDAMIFGSEYNYTNADGGSSGVATNEPVNFAEENALVSFLPRRGQSWFSRLTTGLDKKQTEGPLGRSTLPSPSIGHSRVEIKNIHSGETGSGKVVHEFFTAKDYPFDKFYNGENDIESGKGAASTNLSDNEVNDFMLIPAGLINFEVNNSYLGQGFRFIYNDMHGQRKSIATYGENNDGRYYLTAMQEFKYYEPGEKVLILNPDYSYTYDIPGKEEDITFGMRQFANNTTDISIELDVSIGISFPPLIFITPIPSVALSQKDLSTHVTSKVIRYPAIMKSVVDYKDGQYTVSDFIGFDKFTGKSILTRSIDGFDKVVIDQTETHDGSIYQLELPASYRYEEMQPIFSSSSNGNYFNISNSNQLNDKTARYITYGAEGFRLDTINKTWSLNNYLDVSIQTYSKGSLIGGWYDDNIRSEYNIQAGSEVLNKLNSIYRPYGSYVYKTDITSANDQTTDSKIFEAGIFADYSPFNWDNEASNLNNNWLKTVEVSKYSPNGYPLEEKNILGLYNSVKYGESYKYTVPVIRVDNGEYGTIAFKDFEDSPITFAHSGKGALAIAANENSTSLLDNLYNSQQLREVGAWLKLWVSRENNGIKDPFDGYDNNYPELTASLNNSPQKLPLEFVARSGEWALFRLWIKEDQFNNLQPNQEFSIRLNTDEINSPIFVDDVKFQPFDAKGICFVYSPETLRLIAQFDDQHFALFYQYDSESKLIRKLIETEKGIKTIQESHYNIPLKDRN